MPGLEAYVLRARVIPIAIVVLPALVLLSTGIISGSRLGIATGVVVSVLGALAGQLGRDRGKALQKGLWEEWGGSPTVARLRYRSARAPDAVGRLHRRIEQVLGDSLPSAEEEAADPAVADERYEEAVARLRTLTRDRPPFDVLFEENVSYGQRRNLLGLRTVGIVVASTTLLAAIVLLVAASGTLSERAARYLPGGAAAVVLLWFWVNVVTRSWVRTSAEAYADQLVATPDLLAVRNPGAPTNAQKS